MQTLRRANARYSQVAAEFRALSRPAKKARRHAEKLQLEISVEAASKLDQKQISTIPLPVLDLAPSPPPEIKVTAAPKIIAPVARYPAQVATDKLASKVTRPSRPILRCVIPQIIVQEDVVSSIPDVGFFASKWSASTTGTGETDEREGDDEDFELDVPQPARIGVRYPTDNNENMDIIVSPDDDDQENDEAFRLSPVIIHIEPEIQNQNYSSRPLLPTRIPRQSPLRQQQLELAQNFAPPSAEALGLAGSGSGSSQLSHEVVTPITPGELPISLVRIKRKSLSLDVGMDDADHYMVVEKRPKYERKVFAISANDRRAHQRAPSWSRRDF